MRVCVVLGLLISLVALNSGVNAEDIRAKKRKRKSKAGAPSSGAFSDVTVDSAGGLSSGQPAQGSATATSRRAASANNVDPSSDIAAASKLTDKAMELVRSGRHAAALSPFQQACLLEPDNAGRWWVLNFKSLVVNAGNRII
jgi:Flp pilus assembly protein TadD